MSSALSSASPTTATAAHQQGAGDSPAAVVSLDDIDSVLAKLPEIQLQDEADDDSTAASFSQKPAAPPIFEELKNSGGNARANKRLSAMVFGLKKTMSDWISHDKDKSSSSSSSSSVVAGIKVDDKVKAEMDDMFGSLDIKVSL
ncbi:hypothetical protein HDU84_003503 [Entophlyctis sp. JEL0112]|nr:hypothetical protein HDU84_003503 [Entophlyctis sp. JEL0112]